MKVVLCVPTLKKPYQATLDAIAASVPLLDEYEIDHCMVSEVGCPYISAARSTMLRKALDAGADRIVFIDHDVSWDPINLVQLILADGQFVMGTYRFKQDEEEYMGQLLHDNDGSPLCREDGALSTYTGPAGFLRINRSAINRLIERYPDLCYGERHAPHFDLFNHGAYKFTWWGEDYAACRRWVDIGGEIWTLPNMNINHHGADGTVFRGNLHEFLMRQPGGSNEESV